MAIITRYFGRDGRVTRIHTGSEDDPQFAELSVDLAEYPDARGDLAAWPAVVRAQKISEVKAEAQKRILAIIPQWKQADLTARAVELIIKMTMGGTLTLVEKDEMAAGFELWSQVKAIRSASDLIEQDIAASTDPASFDVAGSSRWLV